MSRPIATWTPPTLPDGRLAVRVSYRERNRPAWLIKAKLLAATTPAAMRERN